MNLTETYTLQDIHRYDSGTTDKSSNYTKTSNLSITHDTDHYILSASSNNAFVTIDSGLNNVIFEADLKYVSSARGLSIGSNQNTFYNNGTLITWGNTGFTFFTHNNNNYSEVKRTSTSQLDDYCHFKLQISGDAIYFEVSDGSNTYISGTHTKSISNKYLMIALPSGGSCHIKNIKVKEL